MSARIEIFQDSPPDDWDDAIKDLGGSIFHSSYWAEYQRHTQNCQPVFLRTRDSENKVNGSALAFYRQSTRPIASKFFRSLELSAHPATVSDNETSSEIVEECEGYARQRGCYQITLNSNMSGESAFIPANGGYQEMTRYEFIVDLTRDSDSLWQEIAKDQRNRIRRLERDRVVIRVGKDIEDLQGLRIAREATQSKRSRKGQSYDLSDDDKFYEKVYSFLLEENVGRLFIAKTSSDVIAAIFFMTFNGQAYSMFSGSTDAGYKLGVQSGLFWEAVKAFKDDGFYLLNRGGVPAEAAQKGDDLHGIYEFKKRLGTTPILCRSGIKILHPLKYQLANLRSHIQRHH